MTLPASDSQFMRQAIDISRRGEGGVEPNPMVGCVIVRDGRVLGEGWHQKFGGPHAEVDALQACDEPVAGATAYVSLEPCSHTGKTPPCCDALIKARIAKVVVACLDPNPDVAGNGIRKLQQAGIEVTTGVLRDEAGRVLAPYLKRTTQGLPWVIAKWAMTIDGKIASASRDSQWISNERSRMIVHHIRGRVDAILVGRGTALADDPLLTARPPGPRTPLRIVLDSAGKIPLDSKLLKTARKFPTLIAVGPNADAQSIESITSSGCEVWQSDQRQPDDRLTELLKELAQRGMTSILVEGGSEILGSFHAIDQIDEVHCFIGPKILGGRDAKTPIGGVGHSRMNVATGMDLQHVESIGDDVYCVWRKSE